MSSDRRSVPDPSTLQSTYSSAGTSLPISAARLARWRSRHASVDASIGTAVTIPVLVEDSTTLPLATVRFRATRTWRWTRRRQTSAARRPHRAGAQREPRDDRRLELWVTEAGEPDQASHVVRIEPRALGTGHVHPSLGRRVLGEESIVHGHAEVGTQRLVDLLQGLGREQTIRGRPAIGERGEQPAERIGAQLGQRQGRDRVREARKGEHSPEEVQVALTPW